MKITIIYVALFALLLVQILAGPTFAAESPAAPRGPVKAVFLIDRSPSTCDAQRTAWKTSTITSLQGAKPGDLIEIREISDVTDAAAPFFSETYPVKRGTGRASDQRHAAEVQAYASQMRAALALAFGPPGERKILASDLVSGFRYLRPVTGMDVIGIIESDFLHVDSPTWPGERVNMEALDLTRVNLTNLISILSKARGWSPQTLRGAKVHGLLNDAALCSVPSRNRPAQLRGVYGPMIKALGGELAGFDTILVKGVLQ